jgi:BirA family biotin operon repressor/biotin-[acetyl-CoA-carboxylase] ligase
LVRLDVCASTNDVARRLAAAGLPEGTAVIALTQERGRGRQGRVWISPLGGLWCSFILRPATQTAWGRLSLAASVATAEAIEQTAGLRAAIRWPNDVIVCDRKVAGILLEAAAGAVMAGIGINANVPADDLPAALRDRAGSLHELSGRAVPLAALFDALRSNLARWYSVWRGDTDDDAARIIGAWSARDATRGRPVEVQIGDGRVHGIAEGVDASGALRVRAADGSIRTVVAGDILAPAIHAARGGRSDQGDV